MTRAEQFERHRDYIAKEGLDQLVDFGENHDFEEGVFDAVSGKLQTPFPPEPADLVRLHQQIRSRKSFTVLEFGLGYSTVIMADALRKNEADWQRLPNRPAIRNRFMFKLFAVDASRGWIDRSMARVPADLRDRITATQSDVEIGTFNGQLCHYYTRVPDVVADFIYLDGPSPKNVQGSIRGLTFQCDERTVMSGDLLLMESTFLPGTVIYVDGRTNNARFLARHFTRRYRTTWSREDDYTLFELEEERLGKYNLLGSDFF